MMNAKTGKKAGMYRYFQVLAFSLICVVSCNKGNEGTNSFHNKFNGLLHRINYVTFTSCT